MSSPSFENIDQWFFEFTEGNLSVNQQSQLFDFLRDNPELLSELEAWQKAKAPKVQMTMDTGALIKKAPFYLQPFAIASFSFLLVGLSLLGWFLMPTEAHYSLAYLDTDIIHLPNDNKNQLIINTFPKSEDYENASHLEIPIEYAHNVRETGNENLYANNLAWGTQESTTNFSVGVSTNSTDYPTDYSLINKGTNQFENSGNVAYGRTDQEELDMIIAYLSEKNIPETNYDLDHNLTAETSEITNEKTVKTKASRQVTFSSIMSSIKRMVDQPTSIRNTRDPYYHAPMMTGFKPNSSMVGAYGNRIQATSRVQWVSHENSQMLNTVSWDNYLYALRGGVGVDLNYNTYNMGAITDYSVGLTYSPKLAITKNIMFSPSLHFKMGVIDVNNSENLRGSNIEINRNNLTPFFLGEAEISGRQLWYRDIGLGFMLNTQSFYLGFNMDNLGRHHNNFYSGDLEQKYRESIYYTAVIGAEYQSLTKDVSVDGYGLFQSYGNLTEFWLGGNFRYKWFQTGIGVNTKADVGASMGVHFNRFSFHYNVDYLKSSLLDKKLLSHQVTMKIMLKPNRQSTKLYNF